MEGREVWYIVLIVLLGSGWLVLSCWRCLLQHQHKQGQTASTFPEPALQDSRMVAARFTSKPIRHMQGRLSPLGLGRRFTNLSMDSGLLVLQYIAAQQAAQATLPMSRTGLVKTSSPCGFLVPTVALRKLSISTLVESCSNLKSTTGSQVYGARLNSCP